MDEAKLLDTLINDLIPLCRNLTQEIKKYVNKHKNLSNVL